MSNSSVFIRAFLLALAVTCVGWAPKVLAADTGLGSLPFSELPSEAFMVVINCPADIVAGVVPSSACSKVVTYSIPTASSTTPILSIIRIAGLASGSSFPVGENTVTYRATDAAGNSATCSFTVTVLDTTRPTITCPANISVVCSDVVTFSTPAGADNCTISSVVLTQGLPSGSVFPLGNTTQTYVATDGAGNTASCSFNITVLDSDAPTITCPANITTDATAGQCAAVVTYSTPTGADNCPNFTVLRTQGLDSGADFSVGVTTMTFTVTDAVGASASCSFTVTVLDNEDPTITCPANVSVGTDAGLCTAMVNYTVAASDNCGSTLHRLAGMESGAHFPTGTTTVSYLNTDYGARTASCSFTVTVSDTEVPVLVNCPTNVVVPATPGRCDATVAYTAPTATDNCAGTVVARTAGLPSGSLFPVGVTTVTHTATDAAGNAAACTFTITVTDGEAPMLVCPVGIVVDATTVDCDASVAYTITANDNCPGMTLVRTAGLPSGADFPVGTTTVAFQASDMAGNVNVCSFTVKVNPVYPPCLPMPCLPGGIRFGTQAQIDNFADDYPGCTIILGSVEIWESVPANITDLGGLSHLTEIRGNLTISNNAILTSLQGLENMEEASLTNLSILNNPILSDCAAQTICDYLTAPGNLAMVSGNQMGCQTIPQVQAACAALPVIWGQPLVATAQAEGVGLRWSVLQQFQNHSFTVEHSTDGRSFSALATLPAGTDQTGEQTFAYLHPKPAPGSHYYRIRQTDVDGTFTFGNLATATVAAPTHQPYPNPAADHVFVDVDTPTQLRVFHASGKTMGQYALQAGTNSIAMEGYPAGMYVFQTADGISWRVVKE